MQTMHPVLQVGPFDQAANPVSAETGRLRLEDVGALLRDRGYSGLMIFGNRSEYGTINYLTGYTPRLGDAILLVSQAGEAEILAFEGKRMVDAGKQTTWLENVQPVGDLTQMVSDWLKGLGGGALATCHTDLMNDGFYRPISHLPQIAGSVDATSDIVSLRRCKSELEQEMIAAGARAISFAETAASAALEAGQDVRRIGLAGEAAACRTGAQDVRAVFSMDGGCTMLPLSALPESRADSLLCYFAVRFWGYWCDGYFVAGKKSESQQRIEASLADLLAVASSGLSVASLSKSANSARLSVGLGIGASVEEVPSPLDQDAQLAEGDICSFRLVETANGGSCASASAVARVRAEGLDIIWRSGDGGGR